MRRIPVRWALLGLIIPGLLVSWGAIAATSASCEGVIEEEGTATYPHHTQANVTCYPGTAIPDTVTAARTTSAYLTSVGHEQYWLAPILPMGHLREGEVIPAKGWEVRVQRPGEQILDFVLWLDATTGEVVVINALGSSYE